LYTEQHLTTHALASYNVALRARERAASIGRMAKKKKPVKSASRDRHTTPRVVFHLAPDLLAVIDAERAEGDRTRTAEIVRALKSYYRGKGLWPPAGRAEDLDRR
jgi:uncharacterized membrane protein